MAKELSRAQRRAKRRLAEKMAAYEAICKKDKNGSKAYTKPGNGRCW